LKLDLGFRPLLDRIEGNGVRTVVVEDALRPSVDRPRSRPHRPYRTGVRVLTASGDDLTASDDPFEADCGGLRSEKARLVGKLKAARERKRATGVKVEGQELC
jgi:hypothetical protein